MVNKTMLARGNQSSVIRELFEYGKIRKNMSIINKVVAKIKKV